MVYTITLNPAIDNVLKFDSFSLGSTNRVVSSFKYAAGKGIHVSKLLTNLNIENKAIYLSGKEDVYFSNDLKRQKIQSIPFYTSGFIRNNFKIIDSKTQSEINGIGLLVNKESLKKLNVFIEKNINQEDFVVLSGSFPQNMSFEQVEEICKQIKSKTNKIIFDLSNIDFLLKLLKFKPLLIKPNNSEMQKMLETTTIEQMLDKGVENIVVSHGSTGCSWYKKNFVKHYKIKRTFKVKNQAGAGDSMVGAIVSKLVAKNSFEKALVFGIVASVATVCSERIASKEKIKQLEKDANKWIF